MQAKTKPFGIMDKLGYAAGDIANNFTFFFVSGYLMLFYTDVWGIDGKIVASLFVLARILDAFTDVGMGTIVDRFMGNKDGKFRPFIKWGAIPVAFASFLLFQTGLKDMSMTFKIIYMYITYLLWGSICYTFINIPYGSMASAISPDTDDRTELSTFRTIGTTVAQLSIGFVTPFLLYKKTPGEADVLLHGRFPIVAGVFGILAVLSYMFCFKSVTERVNVAKETKKTSILSGIFNLLNKRSLVAIILISILQLLALLLVMAMNAYVYNVYFKNSVGMSLAGLAMNLPVLLTAPIAMKLGQTVGKKEASTIGVLGSGLILLALFLLKVKNMYVFLFTNALAFMFLGIFNSLTWAMITDVIDDLEIKNKQRDDGKVYAIYSFARKLGQAAAGGLGGFALASVGYVSGLANQSTEVANGIYRVTTLMPAIALIVAGLILLFIYPLDRKTVLRNNEILEENR